MKQLFTLFLLSFSIVYSQAQEVDFDKKTNMITVDGVNAFKVEREGCGFGETGCHYDVIDLQGNKLFKVNYRDFNSPVEVSKANPNGTVRYLEFVFFGTKQKAEVDFPGIKCEKVGKIIVKNHLIVDGKLDPKAVDDFVFSSGTPFSERVKF